MKLFGKDKSKDKILMLVGSVVGLAVMTTISNAIRLHVDDLLGVIVGVASLLLFFHFLHKEEVIVWKLD